MFDFPFLRREPPVLKGKRATLRFPRPSDYREWAALRRDSRAFLEPWEPRWAPDELHRSGWNNRVRRYRQEYAAGSAIAYLIFENEEDRMVGGITIGNIRYGVAQTAQIGYWMGERYAGKGYMQDAIQALISYAFDQMRLHRIEAACIPSNARSIHVLQKAGFTREGLLRSYLRINGVWQDHFIYALIADDRRAMKQEADR